jgi:hypothetical protein
MTFQTTTQRGSDGAKYTALLAVRELVERMKIHSQDIRECVTFSGDIRDHLQSDSADVRSLIEQVDEVRAAVEWSQADSDVAVAMAHKLRGREATTLAYVDSRSNVRLENTYSADVRILEHRKLVKTVTAVGSRGGKKLWVEVTSLGMDVARAVREIVAAAEE